MLCDCGIPVLSFDKTMPFCGRAAPLSLRDISPFVKWGNKTKARFSRRRCRLRTVKQVCPRIGAENWWSCAELNCGLTRFKRGHYTLSLRLISPKTSPQTNSLKACFRKAFHKGGNAPLQKVAHFHDALQTAMGNGMRTELNAVKPQVLRGG